MEGAMVRIRRGGKNHRRGFTLIELIIALGVVVLLLSGIGASIRQVFLGNGQSVSYMVAVKQVENALHQIDRDAQMAFPSRTSVTDAVRLAESPLRLEWLDSDNVTHVVTYSLGDDRVMIRGEIVGEGETQDSASGPVASYLDPILTTYRFDGRSLFISLTVTVRGMRTATETRTLQVKMRPTQ